MPASRFIEQYDVLSKISYVTKAAVSNNDSVGSDYR